MSKGSNGPNLYEQSMSFSDIGSAAFRALWLQKVPRSQGETMVALYKRAAKEGFPRSFVKYLKANLHDHPGGGTDSRLCRKGGAGGHFTPRVYMSGVKVLQPLLAKARAIAGQTLSLTEFNEGLCLAYCPKDKLRQAVREFAQSKDEYQSYGGMKCKENCLEMAKIFTR